MFHINQRLSDRVGTLARVLGKLMFALLLLLMGAFVFLRTYGVPDPILREVVRRINEAGVPIEIESVRLTLRGWRAVNVRYYSKCADDLEPIIHAEVVLFKRAVIPGHDHAEGLVFDVDAKSVEFCPSIEWGVAFPDESAFRVIDNAQVAVSFLPDRILLTGGSLSWMGAIFHVEGTIMKAAEISDIREESKLPMPVLVSAGNIQALEHWLASLDVSGAAVVDVAFMVDAGNYEASTLDCSVGIDDLAFRGVTLSRAELSLQYVYPRVNLKKASLHKDNQSLRIEGSYDMGTQLAEVSAFNDIQSKRLLLLLPQRVLDVMNRLEFGFESMPSVDIHFGPAPPMGLLGMVSGSFSVRDAMYRHLEIESLSGNVERKGQRLTVTDLQGVAGGQESRADEVGSCMSGGAAKGEFFWDAGTCEYGVNAEGSFDPNLLVGPLSFCSVATNIIQLFRFGAHPPQARVELGQNYSMDNTFHINIQGSASDMFMRDVPLSSVSAAVAYKNGVVTVDPLVAKQGADFIKGSTALDFINGVVTFDGFGSISPAALEDVIYPGLNLFGNHIQFLGKREINAHGCVDWRHMQATDFKVDIEAEHVRTPVAMLDGLVATVTGKGPEVRVDKSAFSMYDGQGSGALTLHIDPHVQGVPYGLDVEVGNVDFKKFLQFLRPESKQRVSGKMSGKAHIEADFLRDFHATANGTGNVKVVDGQLADLPLFSGFSKAMRKVIPSFSVFSINSLSGDFDIENGVIRSKNAYFDGELISAKGKGSYSRASGFDARVQAQVFSESRLSKVLRVITDPIFKLFELRLEGPLSDPSWRLDKFTSNSDDSSSSE